MVNEFHTIDGKEAVSRIKKAISVYYPGFTPSEIQRRSIPEIMKGKDLLLISPTGSGKTEAALFPILTLILSKNEDAISVLYITPMRALNRDIFRRMVEFSNSVGVMSAVRHGDTTQSERLKQIRNPPKLMITTPETMQNLFLSTKLRGYLSNVQHIIIDEIHELISSERGLQFSIALSRLRKIARYKIHIVALSATVGNPEEISRYISSGNVAVIREEQRKSFNIAIHGPSADLKHDAEAVSTELSDIYKSISDDIRKHKKVLIFVNTRDFGEVVTLSLTNISKDLKIAIHHSSLSREIRINAEREFREDELNAVVATSSLELGIDIGSIDYVIQINSPRQVMRFIQRIGRAGHGIGRISDGAIYSDTVEDLIESAVIVKRAMENKVEERLVRRNSPAVIANQIVAIAIEYSKTGRPACKDMIYSTIRSSYPFSDLSSELFERIILYLQSIKIISMSGDLVVPRRRGYEYFYDNISMIPDERSYRVRDIAENKIIGKVDERYYINAKVGDLLLIKGRTWIIGDLTEEEVHVKSELSEASPPKWRGEEIPVSIDVAMNVGAILKYRNFSGYNLDENAIKFIEKTLQRWDGHVYPSSEKIVIEYSGMQPRVTIMHTFFGTKVNYTLGLYISHMLSLNRQTIVEFRSDQYRIMVNTDQNPTIDEIRNILVYAAEDGVFVNKMQEIISDVINIKWDLLYAAKKIGVISKSVNYAAINMDAFLNELRNTPVEEEAIDRVMYNRMDVGATIKVLEAFKLGKYSMVIADIPITDRDKLYFRQEVESNEIPKEILSIVMERLKKSLLSTVCLKCGTKITKNVGEIMLPTKCPVCEGTNIAVVKGYDASATEILKKYINRKKITNREMKRVKSLYNSANLLRTYGYNMLYAMAGIGIGPAIASNILFQSGNDTGKLIGLIIKKENEFRKNKIYWS